MFIQTEETPNPATLKFLPGRDVMGAAPPADFPNAESAKASPLAETLFKTQVTQDPIRNFMMQNEIDIREVTQGVAVTNYRTTALSI